MLYPKLAQAKSVRQKTALVKRFKQVHNVALATRNLTPKPAQPVSVDQMRAFRTRHHSRNSELASEVKQTILSQEVKAIQSNLDRIKLLQTLE